MTITHNKKQNNKSTFGSIIAEVAGAVAVVGITAGAMALKDEKNRKKVKKVLSGVKDQVINYVEKLKTEPSNQKTIQKVKKIATDTKKVLKEI